MKKAHLDLLERYERGEVTDDELLYSESLFHPVEQDYHEQQKSVSEKYPDAAREQWLFDYLCELVGISVSCYGPYARPQDERDWARREIWKVIDELSKTWDKGDIYYPHPSNPELRHALVRDLRNSKKRTRARERNRADMQKGRPYRDPGTLMADPIPKKKKDEEEED